nr:hypothetical protein [Tanacetum cinerariifolium]
MGDEHLDTIPGKESDEFIKSSIKNLVPNPKSLLNQDSSIIFSPKIDSLLEEFSGELADIDLISIGIVETDFDPEDEICFVERL